MTKRKFDPVHPGVVLAEDFLKGLEISQYRLARGIAVSARRINEIVQGKRCAHREDDSRKVRPKRGMGFLA
jgi:addiction module HigA family antidote